MERPEINSEFSEELLLSLFRFLLRREIEPNPTAEDMDLALPIGLRAKLGLLVGIATDTSIGAFDG